MGLIERLKRAELKGRDAATRAFDRVVHTSEDIERKLRRKMRVYPNAAVRNAAAPTPSEVSQAIPAGESAPAEYQEQRKGMEIAEEPVESGPIVSIAGKDVGRVSGRIPRAPDVKEDPEAA